MSPPSQRPEFEDAYEAGPVGVDIEDRPVIIERAGKPSAALFLSQMCGRGGGAVTNVVRDGSNASLLPYGLTPLRPAVG